ncbi:MAG: zinc ribbon domain-containing protein [Sandaracinaceae bacterium]|nr:zinc ribbon domain-containing protein [Sandaracinaceae bacterium]
MIPAFFMVLAGAAAMAAMAALWVSLRVAFGGGRSFGSDTARGLPERTALEAEKHTLLRAIKDIAFERELGKLSDEDFERLDRAYRARAKRVLALLDQDIEPFLVRAENEIAEAMGESEDRGPYRRGGAARKKGKHRAKGGEKRPARPARAAKLAPAKGGLECPACGVDNDLDAQHCKSCGARVAPIVCEACGTENDPDARFCKGCAAKLGGEAADARR